MNRQLRHLSRRRAGPARDPDRVDDVLAVVGVGRPREPAGTTRSSSIAQLTVDRGKIFAADGTLLATNRVSHKHGLTVYTRHYPQNDLASQVIGYATPAARTTGLEQSLDDYLTGANTNLSNTFKQDARPARRHRR